MADSGMSELYHVTGSVQVDSMGTEVISLGYYHGTEEDVLAYVGNSKDWVVQVWVTDIRATLVPYAFVRGGKIVIATEWEPLLQKAATLFLAWSGQVGEHTKDTARRVADHWRYMVSGYKDPPGQYLKASFGDTAGYSQMIHVRGIPVVSTCSHHFLPFVGEAHFAYIPDGRVVGLSKIYRFIDALSRRLQVQEKLTEEIVNMFSRSVDCLGCGVKIKARHMCVECRGVRVAGSEMETTALRGGFFDHEPTRMEFLNS